MTVIGQVMMAELYVVDFHQHFTSGFLYESFLRSLMCLQFGIVIFCQKEISKKADLKMLVNLARKNAKLLIKF
jgi:hypothetical protein